MKQILLSAFVLYCCITNAQVINISSFQHTIRWLDEVRFQPYITHENVKDTILEAAAREIGKHFNTTAVIKPRELEYKKMDMFGKPKMNDPAAGSNARDMQAAILSVITRATTGYAVFWSMKVVVTQDGKTVYSHEIKHELEYESASGYLSSVSWFTEEKYIQLYKTLLAELFENSEALAEKISVSTKDDKDAEAKTIIPNAERLMLKTNGNLLGGGNFIVSLQHETDTLATVVYHDGWDIAWPKISMSAISASFFKSITGWEIGYTTKSKEKRFGRLAYTDGHEIRLRMEWMEETHQYTDGSIESSRPASPMVTEAFENDKLIAYFTFITKYTEEPKGQLHKVSTLLGKLGEDSISAVYDPYSQFITIKENGNIKAMLLMQNMNPDSRSVSNSTISKNKVFVMGSASGPGVGPKKFKEPEWYYWYHEQGHKNTETLKYLDILLCLFFGMGKNE